MSSNHKHALIYETITIMETHVGGGHLHLPANVDAEVPTNGAWVGLGLWTVIQTTDWLSHIRHHNSQGQFLPASASQWPPRPALPTPVQGGRGCEYAAYLISILAREPGINFRSASIGTYTVVVGFMACSRPWPLFVCTVLKCHTPSHGNYLSGAINPTTMVVQI